MLDAELLDQILTHLLTRQIALLPEMKGGCIEQSLGASG
jgi:hypothetical protein